MPMAKERRAGRKLGVTAGEEGLAHSRSERGGRPDELL